jgi:proteasome lid subunit RPN8/RPN11
MAIEDIQEALNEVCKINGDSVLGVFHTHPNDVPWPTPGDISGWPNPDLEWRYWIATNHEVIEWSKGR